MRPALRAWARALAVTACAIGIDQATKALVRAEIERGERRELIGGVLDLVHVRNNGVAFGALAGGGTIVVVVIVVALIGLIAYFATHATKPYAWIPTGMLIGGAVGNIIDRLRQGAVTDFIKFPHWPAFNAADTFITLGVIALVIVLERNSRHASGRDG